MRATGGKTAIMTLTAITFVILFLPGAAAAQGHVSMATDASPDRGRVPIPEAADTARVGEPFRAYNDLLKMRSKCKNEAQKFIQRIREEFPDANSEVRQAVEPLFQDALDKNNRFNEAIYNFIRGGNRGDLRNQWIDAEFAYVTLMNSRADSHGRRNVCKNCITVIYPLASSYWCGITNLQLRKQLAEDFLAGVKWD